MKSIILLSISAFLGKWKVILSYYINIYSFRWSVFLVLLGWVSFAQALTPLTGVTQIWSQGKGSMSGHSCAIISGGGVKCWGDNADGQLGDGSVIQQNIPIDVSGLTSGVAAIAAGGDHSCALTSGSGMKCWGQNNHGQLGDGSGSQQNFPIDVNGLTSGVAAIAIGSDHSCALIGGGVKCWGQGDQGQVGNGGWIDGFTPSDVSGLTSGVAAIALGYDHSCALLTSASVKCWGDNINGQLGNGITVDSNIPVAVSGLTGVTAIALGRFHTCALTSSGGVKCWGRNNDYGQLGDGTMTDRLTPVDVSGLTSGVTAIALGAYHTCALTNGGGVKCWGRNDNGRVGDGSTTDRNTPVDVSGLTSGVTAIALGYSYSCALLSSGGRVKCWGGNGAGALGDNTTTDRLTPVDVLMLAPEINIDGNSINIVNGDITPSVADNTDFGNVVVGNSVSKTFTIINDGELLTLTLPVNLIGAGCTYFGVTSPPTSPVAVSGGTTTFTITYTPTIVTTDTCTVSIANDDSDENPYSFTIQGIGLPPIPIPGYGSPPLPGTITNVGTSLVGTSVTTDLTLSEVGNVPLTVGFTKISGTHASDFKINTSLFPITIADGGAAVPVTVTCTPSATGVRTATLELTSNDPNYPTVSYSLSCTGILPGYQSTPAVNTVLNIGEALVKSGISKTFTVTEQGIGDLKISTLAITGEHASDFAVITPLFPLTIVDDSNVTKTIRIRCIPSALGLRTATLELTSNDPKNPKPTYPLECTGTVLTAGYTATLPTTKMLDFGSQPVGTTVTRSFDISETGNTALTVALLSLDNPTFQIISPSFPLTVADGSSPVTVTIQCQPTTVGIHYSELKLSTNDPLNSAITYTLTCIGEDITPTFNSIPKLGETLTFSNLTDYNAHLTIAKVGNGPLEIKTATFSGEFAQNFTITANQPPLTLANGSLPQTLTLHCVTEGDKIAAATLQLTTNDPNHALVNYPLICANLHSNHLPTDILLSNTVITPEMPKETAIAVFNTIDPEIENFPTTNGEALCAACHAPQNIPVTKPTYTYTLLENTSGLFKIVGNQLQLAEVLPSPVATVDYPIVIRSTDSTGLFLDKSFIIHVTVEQTAELIGAIYTSMPLPNGMIRFNPATVGTPVHADLVITNNGQQELQIDFVEFNGPNASNFNLITSLPLHLAGQSSQTLTMDCIPPESGFNIAKLILSSNDELQPSPTYTLLCGSEKSGPGYLSLPLPDSILDIGSSPIGQAITADLNILEIGTETLEITDVAIVGSHAADFTISEPHFSLKDGADPYTLKIQCIPQNICQQTARLILATNDPSRPAVNYELSCQGFPATTIIDSPIYLSNQTIDENLLGDSFVGRIRTDDADPQGYHQYELVCDPQRKFAVIGDGLYTAPDATFDFATQNSYPIVIKSTNSSGTVVFESFTIWINEVDEAKILSGLILTELGNQGRNVTIDSPEVITLKVLIDPPPEHLGRTAKVNMTVRYLPLDQGRPLTVKRPTRSVNLSGHLELTAFWGRVAGYSGTFHVDANYQLSNGVKVSASNIAILQVRRNRLTTGMSLVGNHLAKAAPTGTVIGILSSIDSDKTEQFTYIVIDNPKNYFMVFGNKLQRADTPYSIDLYKKIQVPITVRAIDTAGDFFDQKFTISIE